MTKFVPLRLVVFNNGDRASRQAEKLLKTNHIFSANRRRPNFLIVRFSQDIIIYSHQCQITHAIEISG